MPKTRDARYLAVRVPFHPDTDFASCHGCHFLSLSRFACVEHACEPRGFPHGHPFRSPVDGKRIIWIARK